MSEQRVWGIHYTIRSLILFGFAWYIVYLVKSDALLYYIAPKMQIYVKLSAIALHLVAIHQAVSAFRAFFGKTDICSCQHGDHDHTPSRSLWKNSVVYGLFIVPLLMGFLMPDTVMGSSLAAKKGMNLSGNSIRSAQSQPEASNAEPDDTPDDLASLAQEQPEHATSDDSTSPADVDPQATQPTNNEDAVPPDASPPTESETPSHPVGPDSAVTSTDNDEGTVTEIATEVDLDTLFPPDDWSQAYADYGKTLYVQEPITVEDSLYIEGLTTLDLYLDAFIGKKIRIAGFVYREDSFDSDQFVVARFSIQCCAADAAPFGTLVQYAEAARLADDDWVEVTGTITRANFNGYDMLQIVVDDLVPIAPPADPYIYPNYDFGM